MSIPSEHLGDVLIAVWCQMWLVKPKPHLAFNLKGDWQTWRRYCGAFNSCLGCLFWPLSRRCLAALHFVLASQDASKMSQSSSSLCTSSLARNVSITITADVFVKALGQTLGISFSARTCVGFWFLLVERIRTCWRNVKTPLWTQLLAQGLNIQVWAPVMTVCREVRWGIQIQFKRFCRSMTAIQPWSQVMNTWADVSHNAYRWHEHYNSRKRNPPLGSVIEFSEWRIILCPCIQICGHETFLNAELRAQCDLWVWESTKSFDKLWDDRVFNFIGQVIAHNNFARNICLNDDQHGHFPSYSTENSWSQSQQE